MRSLSGCGTSSSRSGRWNIVERAVTEPERTESERAELGVNVAATAEAANAQHRDPSLSHEPIFKLHDVNVAYGGARAVADVSMEIYKNQITALIGPSGC